MFGERKDNIALSPIQPPRESIMKCVFACAVFIENIASNLFSTVRARQ